MNEKTLFSWNRSCNSIFFYFLFFGIFGHMRREKAWLSSLLEAENPPQKKRWLLSALQFRETAWSWPLLTLNLIHSTVERWCFHTASESRPDKSSHTALTLQRRTVICHTCLKKCFCEHPSHWRHLAGSHREEMRFLDDASILTIIQMWQNKQARIQQTLKFWGAKLNFFGIGVLVCN